MFREKLPTVSRSWDEGKFFDFWSAVHFLSGAFLGLAALQLPFSFLESLAGAVILLVLYEVWEARMSIMEHLANRVVDVLIGGAGFVASYQLARSYLTTVASVLATVGLATFLALFVTFGWRAYIRRKLARRDK